MSENTTVQQGNEEETAREQQHQYAVAEGRRGYLEQPPHLHQQREKCLGELPFSSILTCGRGSGEGDFDKINTDREIGSCDAVLTSSSRKSSNGSSSSSSAGGKTAERLSSTTVIVSSSPTTSKEGRSTKCDGGPSAWELLPASSRYAALQQRQQQQGAAMVTTARQGTYSSHQQRRYAATENEKREGSIYGTDAFKGRQPEETGATAGEVGVRTAGDAGMKSAGDMGVRMAGDTCVRCESTQPQYDHENLAPLPLPDSPGRVFCLISAEESPASHPAAYVAEPGHGFLPRAGISTTRKRGRRHSSSGSSEQDCCTQLITPLDISSQLSDSPDTLSASRAPGVTSAGETETAAEPFQHTAEDSGQERNRGEEAGTARLHAALLRRLYATPRRRKFSSSSSSSAASDEQQTVASLSSPALLYARSNVERNGPHQQELQLHLQLQQDSLQSPPEPLPPHQEEHTQRLFRDHEEANALLPQQLQQHREQTLPSSNIVEQHRQQEHIRQQLTQHALRFSNVVATAERAASQERMQSVLQSPQPRSSLESAHGGVSTSSSPSLRELRLLKADEELQTSGGQAAESEAATATMQRECRTPQSAAGRGSSWDGGAQTPPYGLPRRGAGDALPAAVENKGVNAAVVSAGWSASVLSADAEFAAPPALASPLPPPGGVSSINKATQFSEQHARNHTRLLLPNVRLGTESPQQPQQQRPQHLQQHASSAFAAVSRLLQQHLGGCVPRRMLEKSVDRRGPARHSRNNEENSNGLCSASEEESADRDRLTAAGAAVGQAASRLLFCNGERENTAAMTDPLTNHLSAASDDSNTGVAVRPPFAFSSENNGYPGAAAADAAAGMSPAYAARSSPLRSLTEKDFSVRCTHEAAGAVRAPAAAAASVLPRILAKKGEATAVAAKESAAYNTAIMQRSRELLKRLVQQLIAQREGVRSLPGAAPSTAALLPPSSGSSQLSAALAAEAAAGRETEAEGTSRSTGKRDGDQSSETAELPPTAAVAALLASVDLGEMKRVVAMAFAESQVAAAASSSRPLRGKTSALSSDTWRQNAVGGGAMPRGAGTAGRREELLLHTAAAGLEAEEETKQEKLSSSSYSQVRAHHLMHALVQQRRRLDEELEELLTKKREEIQLQTGDKGAQQNALDQQLQRIRRRQYILLQLQQRLENRTTEQQGAGGVERLQKQKNEDGVGKQEAQHLGREEQQQHMKEEQQQEQQLQREEELQREQQQQQEEEGQEQQRREQQQQEQQQRQVEEDVVEPQVTAIREDRAPGRKRRGKKKPQPHGSPGETADESVYKCQPPSLFATATDAGTGKKVIAAAPTAYAGSERGAPLADDPSAENVRRLKEHPQRNEGIPLSTSAATGATAEIASAKSAEVAGGAEGASQQDDVWSGGGSQVEDVGCSRRLRAGEKVAEACAAEREQAAAAAAAERRELQRRQDLDALARVKRMFLQRLQRQQQSIPQPEESVSEMYWASLLQPTEMLLDRTVALSTSLLQPGVYVHLNKCFWESNRRDWSSDSVYPYSCSSSSCSASVPFRTSRPAVDLLPVYFSSHCTPVCSLAALSPTAAAAAAVAPSDADSILNFCFRVSLLRRRHDGQATPQRRHGSHFGQRPTHDSSKSSSRTTCGVRNMMSRNRGTDIRGSPAFADSGESGKDSRRAASASDEADQIPCSASVEESHSANPLLPGGASVSTSARQQHTEWEDRMEQAIQLLLPFPSTVFPSEPSVAEAAAVSSGPGAAKATSRGYAGSEAAGGSSDATTHTRAVYTQEAAAVPDAATLRCLQCLPVLPPVELRGPRPAWVFAATHAAAAAAKAALAADDAVSGAREKEVYSEAEVCSGDEEKEHQEAYASSVPVSLYGFNLSRRLAAAARDAAFNQIAAAAAAVIARTPQEAAVAAAGAGAASADAREDVMEATGAASRKGAETTEAGKNPISIICVKERGAGSETSLRLCKNDAGTAAVAGEASTNGEHSDCAAAPARQRSVQRRRSSVSSTRSRGSSSRWRQQEGRAYNREERRRSSSARSSDDFDRAWYEASRNTLLRRDPPLRSAWVSNSSRKGSSGSDQRSIHWNRSGHMWAGGSSGYGSNSPSSSGVAWRPSASRASWWAAAGGGSAAGEREEPYFALRDQQQGSAASSDVAIHAEGIFVLRERGTRVPLAVRATVFCPDEENTEKPITTADASPGAPETTATAGSGPSFVGFSSSSSSRSPRTSSPAGLPQQHQQPRGGAAGPPSAGGAASSSSSKQQGGKLMSKLFVVAAHATAAEEPMPAKLKRVKQMAKAWFRHKKLLALLLYWQRSQQQQEQTRELSSVAGRQVQHPAREGKKDWKKKVAEVPAAAARYESSTHLHQESGDEGTARQAAETRGTVEKEALACLLKDERDEARYITHLHFLGHALAFRFCSLVAAVSLGCCPSLRRSVKAKPSSSSSSGVTGRSSSSHGSISASSSRAAENSSSIIREYSGSRNYHDAGGKNSRGGLSRLHARSSGSGARAVCVGQGTSSVVDERNYGRTMCGKLTGKGRQESCWSLRVGLRWRESYFAFEYYVAAVCTPVNAQTLPQPGEGEEGQEGEERREQDDGEKQENQKGEQQKQRGEFEEKHGEDPQELRRHENAGKRHKQHRRGGREGPKGKKGGATEDPRSTRSSGGGRNSSRCSSSEPCGKATADSAAATAVLLIDETLQPCLCDVLAVQHAFQAVVMRLLPFVKINSYILRLLLEGSAELRSLSSSVVQRWGRAPRFCAPAPPPWRQQYGPQAKQHQQEEEERRQQNRQKHEKQQAQPQQQERQRQQEEQKQERQERQPHKQGPQPHKQERQLQQQGRQLQQQERQPQQQEPQPQQQERQPQEQERRQHQQEWQHMGKDAKGEQRPLRVPEVALVNDEEIIAAMEMEERLHRSTALAIAAAFTKDDGGSLNVDPLLGTTEKCFPDAERHSAFLPLFLFDCLLQSKYPSAAVSETAVASFDAASLGAAAASFASALYVAAAAGAPAEEISQQQGTRNGVAAVSLLLAARIWAASLHDRSTSHASPLTQKRTELLVDRSWLPFRLPTLKAERSVASRTRQLLLGTLSHEGSTRAEAATPSAASLSPLSRPTVGSSAIIYGEDRSEVHDVSNGETKGGRQEPRTQQEAVAAKFRKQIKWISVKCSYIGVTDAPATSLKAALLLALLFPSQRQLLLEHLQLQDWQAKQGAATRGAEPDAAAAQFVSEEEQQQHRLSLGFSRGFDAKQQSRNTPPLPQERQPLRGETVQQPLQEYDELEHTRLLRQEHREEEDDSQMYKESQGGKEKGRQQILPERSMEGREGANLSDAKWLARVGITAEMMLEEALEELWPGRDGEENVWKRIFRRDSNSREVLDEIDMLNTEIPSCVRDAGKTAGEEEAEKDAQDLNQKREVQVAAAAPTAESESLLSRQRTAESPHTPASPEGQQQLRPTSEQMYQRQKQQCCHAAQLQHQFQNAEQQSAPPLLRTTAKPEMCISLTDDTKTYACAEEKAVPFGRISHPAALASATNNSAAAVAASQEEEEEKEEDEEEKNDTVLNQAAKDLDFNVKNKLDDRTASREVSVTAVLQKQQIPRKEEGDERKSIAAALARKAHMQSDNEIASTTESNAQQQRATAEGKSESFKEKTKTERFKQLLLLPVECAKGEEEACVRAAARCTMVAGTAAAAAEEQRRIQPLKYDPQRQYGEAAAGEDPQDLLSRGSSSRCCNGSSNNGAGAERVVDERPVGDREALDTPCLFFRNKGLLFFSAFPPFSAGFSRFFDLEDLPRARRDFNQVTFAPLWKTPCRPLPGCDVAPSFLSYAASALRSAVAGVKLPEGFNGNNYAFDGRKRTRKARGGADFRVLLRWCSSCLTAHSSSSRKNKRSTISRSLADSSTLDGCSDGEGSSNSGENESFNDEISCSSSSSREAMILLPSGESAAANVLSNDASASNYFEASGGKATSEVLLDRLLWTSGRKRRMQQPPLWAGGIDVSGLREGLDYRIDWRPDWDIGDGRNDPAATGGGASSSSTVVDSSNSTEEEETSTEERAAEESQKNGATGGAKVSQIEAEPSDGEPADRRGRAEEEEENASGTEGANFQFPLEKKKKFLSERLLSRATPAAAAGGSVQLRPGAVEGKQGEKLPDYIEERLVDQQLRDFLQGLYITIRHARAAAFAARGAAPLLRTTGTVSGASTPSQRDEWSFSTCHGRSASSSASGRGGGRYLTAGGATFQEDVFSGSAFGVAGAASDGGVSFSKQSAWSGGSAAPTWLFNLAAAEAAQRQLRTAERGLLPGTWPAAGDWSYLLLPTAATAAAPGGGAAGGSTSPTPTALGRSSFRQQQEEAKRQQEESRSAAASALAAAAALLRQQQEGLHGTPGGSAAMPWTSLYLAAATEAAAAAAARRVPAPPGCQTRHRAELSLPSSTCSTPRSLHQCIAAAPSAGGVVAIRRGGGTRNAAASPSPAAAADATGVAAAAILHIGSTRGSSAGVTVSNSTSAAAVTTKGSSKSSSTCTSAGVFAPCSSHATAGSVGSSASQSAVVISSNGGRLSGDSGAAAPKHLASALLAALHQQPPPTHSLPHHFFSQHQQRLPQQQPGLVQLRSQQEPQLTAQQELQRRASWEAESLRQPPFVAPSHSRRSSSSVRAGEGGSERSIASFLGSPGGIAAAAAEALQELQQANTRRPSSAGIAHLQGDEEAPLFNRAGDKESKTVAGKESVAGWVQQQPDHGLQKGQLPESQQQKRPLTGEPEAGVGDAQLEMMLQQLAAVLASSGGVLSSKAASSTLEAEAASESASAGGSAVKLQQVAAATAPREASTASYAAFHGKEDAAADAVAARSSSSSGARQDEQVRAVGGSYVKCDEATAAASVAESIPAQTQQHKLQELAEMLRALLTAVDETGNGDKGDAGGALRASAELQPVMTMRSYLMEAAQQGRAVLAGNASQAAVADRRAATAAATGNDGDFFHATSSQSSHMPGGAADEASGLAEKELEMYPLLHSHARGDASEAARRQILQAGSPFREERRALVAGEYVVAAAATQVTRRGLSIAAKDVAVMPPLRSAATAAATGEGVAEEGYETQPSGANPQITERGLATSETLVGGGGESAGREAVASPSKKKRSRYSSAAALVAVTPTSSTAAQMAEQRRGSSRSPGRGHAAGGGGSAALSKEEKWLSALSSSSGRSRRSRRGSVSSRWSGEGLVGTPRSSSGAGLEMAAAAAVATAELSAREKAGAANHRRSREKSGWRKSLSPSPASRHAENGGYREEAESAHSPSQRQHSGAAVGSGEDEMVPVGSLPTGVYFDVARRLWRCQWREEGRLKSKGFSLGHYATLEEAREACILYKCAVSNIPVDPMWLVPEYFPASMASKRVLKHRLPSSLPLTSQESSPAATGVDEPRSPLAVGSNTTGCSSSSAFGDNAHVSGFSRYGTPTTPRPVAAGSNTDECSSSSSSRFLSPQTFAGANNGSTSVGNSSCFSRQPGSKSSSALGPSRSQSPGAVSADVTESGYTPDTRRSGITSSSPRRSSFNSDAVASFPSTESNRQPQHGQQQQFYLGDPLPLPSTITTPSSDVETGSTAQSSLVHRKRRRFTSDAAAAGEGVGGADVPSSEGSATGEMRFALLRDSPEVVLADMYSGRGGALLSGGTEQERDENERERRAWLADMLSESGRVPGEGAGNVQDEASWPSAAEVKEATAMVKAALSQEAASCWSVGAAALDAATDALPAIAAGEGNLNVGGRRSTSQSPRRQLSLLTAAAAAAVPISPSEQEEEDHQRSVFAESRQRRQHRQLMTAADTHESIRQAHRQVVPEQGQPPASLSLFEPEPQGISESQGEQRERLLELLRLVAQAASANRSNDDVSI